MSFRYSLRVSAGSTQQGWTDLLLMLEKVLPVKFDCMEPIGSDAAGELLLGDEPCIDAFRNERRIPSLRVAECLFPRELSGEIEVRFADDPAVPFPFKGRSLRTSACHTPRCLALAAGERPLATSAEGPFWAISEVEGVKHYRSGLPLPRVLPGGSLHDVLSGRRFLEILPLIQWIRGISSNTSFHGPRLRACFVLDDPNLHWPTYGFVDYRKLAAEAERKNYHVSVATIPLDTWFTHKGTAQIFLDNRSRLSLSVHGNDHIRRELGRDYTAAKRLLLVDQANHRIDQLERRSGLKVSRVMIPPHGACSEEMLGTLSICGYEAACISHGSLRAHNGSRSWTKLLGFSPSELVNGCPVLPRWGLSSDLTNTILLAAFLNQAIILRGHQEDLKQGTEILADHAEIINGLGDVAWSNLTELVRGNYEHRVVGTQFQLKPISPMVCCALPDEVSELRIESLLGARWNSWEVQIMGDSAYEVIAGKGFTLAEGRSRRISVRARSFEYSKRKLMRKPVPGASLRRLITECRDRLCRVRSSR